MPLSNNGYKNKKYQYCLDIVNVEYITNVDDRFVKKLAGQIKKFPDKSSIYGHVRIHDVQYTNLCHLKKKEELRQVIIIYYILPSLFIEDLVTSL